MLLTVSAVSAQGYEWENYQCSDINDEQDVWDYCVINCLDNTCFDICLEDVYNACLEYDEPVDEVPEFGTFAAIGVLAIAGLFIYRRRN